MKLAFIYDKNDPGLAGTWYCNNSYRFFIEGLLKNHRINATAIPVEDTLDCSELEGFDVLLFYDIRRGKYLNVDKMSSLKIARAPDSHDINENWIDLCRSFGIKCVFNHHTERYARKYLPKDIRYYQIIFGINKEVYVAKPYLARRKDKILLSGVLGRPGMYVLRKRCNKLRYVDYVHRDPRFIGDKYSELLNQYRATIATCTVCSVYKYFEMPMCGCLSFMEVNAKNGCGKLGFVDGQNAIFINQNNYITRMKEFIDNPNDPRWEKIANNGREFVLANYENRIQVNKLIDIIEEQI